MEHSMEQREYTFAAGLPAAGRALAGVVGSGDLEVLLQPHAEGLILIVVNTSVDGKGAVWDALLARVFGGEPLPAASIIINDCGATPGVVRMRIEQAYEELTSKGQA
jgi:malonate decarboxylase delta subunit